jgi:tetratricopeptide (TPR) repeat protein
MRRLAALTAVFLIVASFGLVRWLRDAATDRFLRTATLEQLVDASRTRTDDVRVFRRLGERASRSGERDLAVQAWWRAVQLAPDSERDWLAWAEAVAQTKGPAAADAILADFLKSHAGSADAHALRAEMFQARGHWDRAYESAHRAVEINPSRVDMWRLAGGAALAARRFSDADADLRRADDLKPGDWRTLLLLGESARAQGRTEDAIGRFRDAVHFAPDEAGPNLRLGEALVRAGGPNASGAEALSALETAAAREESLNREERIALNLARGAAFTRLRRWEDALRVLREGERMAPNRAEVQQALVRVFHGKGDSAGVDRAVQRLREIEQYHGEALRLVKQAGGARTPEAAAVRLRLARLYAGHGDTPEALAEYRALVASGFAPDTARDELKRIEAAQANQPR